VKFYQTSNVFSGRLKLLCHKQCQFSTYSKYDVTIAP